MADLAFRVLGPLEVLAGGQPVAITSTRQRIVLAMLLMAPNHVVTIDMLIDAVWDGEPPPTARGQIQICISALRRLVGDPNFIETSPDGYRIRVAQDQLDYHAFDSALSRGRAAAAQGSLAVALDSLDTAIRLWRGPALAGLPGRVVETLANRLEERRIMAIEDRVEIRLGRGDHRALVEELVALTADHPLRERLWGFQMVALYRSGRQAEALAAYRTARKTLVEELGLEPGEHLRLLERAILAHDASLEVAKSDEAPDTAVRGRPPRQLPADIPDFVGHEDLVGTLCAVLTSAAGGPGRSRVPVAVITGPAGSGKSTVALHTAHLVREHFPDGQLFASMHGNEASPTPAMEVLSSFLRALGVTSEIMPADPDERVNLLRSNLAARRLLIVLDDVADEDQISGLLPGVPGPAVLITSRSRLPALAGAHLAELGLMTDEEGLELLSQIAGPDRIAGDDAVLDLARLCCGLPLALRIAGLRLVAHPHWSASVLVERLADERHRLDELSHGDVGVRPLLALVHQSLSQRAQELFRLLSVLDMPEFSPLIAAALLDTSLAEAARILDELSDSRLMGAASEGGRLACFRFHELTRIYAREHMAGRPPAEAGLAIERVLGCLLAMASEAHLRVYGGDYTVLHGTSPFWDGASQYFDRLLREPMAWFDAERENLRSAVWQAADLGMHEFCWELALVSVALYEARGLFEEWRSTHLVALKAVREAGNRRGQGAVLASLGSLGVGHHSEDDERMLLEALSLFEDVGDVLGQALALRTLAHLDRIQGQLERAVDRYQRALERFRAIDDKGGQTHALSGLARTYLDMGALDQAEALVKESLLLGQQLQNLRLQAQALFRLGEVLLTGSQLLASKAVFQESLHLTRVLGDRVGEAYALSGLGQVALASGDVPSAEIYFTQVMEICQVAPERNIRARALMGLAQVHAERGEHVRAEHYYVQAANSFAEQENRPWRARALEALYAIRQTSERMPMTGD